MKQNLALLRAEPYFDAALDYVEVRLDFLLDFTGDLQGSTERLRTEFAELQEQKDQEYKIAEQLQCILTLRRESDGGLCPDSIPDAEYISLLQKLVVAFPTEHLAYIDLDAPLLLRYFPCSLTAGQMVNSQCELSGLSGVPERQLKITEGLLPFLQILQALKIKLIISLHNFSALAQEQDLKAEWIKLQNLDQLLNRFFCASEVSVNILKLALMINSCAELLRFLRFAHFIRGQSDDLVQNQQTEKRGPYVLLAMGEFGSCSRVLVPHLGCAWTFCSPSNLDAARDMGTVALGQFTLAELEELYHYRQVHKTSDIYGVVGDPIAHSLSPQLHNPIYRQRAWDAVYLRFRVDILEDFLALRNFLPLRGFSCTVPHKETLADLAASGRAGGKASSASHAVQMLGASNTFFQLKMQEDEANCGQWQAENTDIEGFIQPLLEFCREHGILIAGRKAAIIGAGGAARAAVYALLCQGVDCEIYNRTKSRAQALQALFHSTADMQSGSRSVGVVLTAMALEQGLCISADCDLVIQTTSVGMCKAGQSTAAVLLDPVPCYQFRPQQIAYDLVYQPEQTVFLQRAVAAGAWALNGNAMLEKQAMAQIEFFAAQRNA